jgi:hypothetical protein
MKKNDPRNKTPTWSLKIGAGIQKDKFLDISEPEYVTFLKKVVKYTLYRGFFSFGTRDVQEEV